MVAMRRHATIAIAVVLLALSAGCLGFFTGDSGGQATPTTDSQTTEQTTKTETTDSGSKALSSLPPGVTASDVDEQKLFRTHQGILLDSTFTVEKSYDIKAEKASFGSDSVAKKGESNKILKLTRDDGTKRVFFTGGDTTYRLSKSNTTRYAETDEPPTRVLTSKQQVRGVLVGGDYNHVKNTTVDGTPVAVLKTDTIKNEKAVRTAIPGKPSSLSATVYVTSKGVVKKIEYSGEGDLRQGSVSVSALVQVSNVGSTTVDKPSWFDEAQKKAVVMNTERTDSYIKVQMQDGEMIREGSGVSVMTQTQAYQTTLPSQVSPGDTVYLTVKDGKLVTTVNKKPSAGTAPSGRTTVTFRGGTLIYQETLSDE